MTGYELKQILSEHKNWLDNGSGKCADLSGADLIGAKLYQNGIIGDDDLIEDRGYFKGLKVARCILRDIAYEYGVQYEEEIDDDPDEEME